MTSSSSIKKPRALLLAGALAALATISVAGSGLSAAPALGDGCPNAAIRQEQGSMFLAECRAYELVTAPYKEGFEVIPRTFTDDGALAYTSTGIFAGAGYGGAENQYIARRSSTGWATTAPDPPASLFENVLGGAAEQLSADLRSAIFESTPLDDPARAHAYYLRGPDGTLTRVGPTDVPGDPTDPPGVSLTLPFPVFATPDLSHVVFSHYPGAGNVGAAALYEFVGTDNIGPARLVSVDNNGDRIPAEACPNGISDDGRVIVFSTGCFGGSVLARVGGSATVAVSGSECTRTAGDPGGACGASAVAQYAGASTDGSRVFFTTTQQLVNSDTDQASDLYECEIPAGIPSPTGADNSCASLTALTSDAQVENVVAMSDDGSRIYFVAKGVLSGNLGVNDVAAVAGMDNLYAWQKDAAHPAGSTTFIAQLDSNDLQHPQATSDGRYLVFGTASQLVTAGPAADTDTSVDLYRYDLVSRTMVRVSTSTSDGGGNGPFDVLGAGSALFSGSGGRSRRTAMASDGATVVFQTDEALSPLDVDNGPDVYAWHDGTVSLISDGIGGATNPWITSSGQDIFFQTRAHLTAADGDAAGDVYDARVDGGFDLSRSTPCSGDACQGPSSTPPVFGAPASESLEVAGSLPSEAARATPKATSRPLTRQQELVKAMKVCRKKPKHKRVPCERQAQKRYGPVNKSARRSHR